MILAPVRHGPLAAARLGRVAAGQASCCASLRSLAPVAHPRGGRGLGRPGFRLGRPGFGLGRPGFGLGRPGFGLDHPAVHEDVALVLVDGENGVVDVLLEALQQEVAVRVHVQGLGGLTVVEVPRSREALTGDGDERPVRRGRDRAARSRHCAGGRREDDRAGQCE
ncbi:hypothetical protein C5746_36015 [Streptomyces atratus]|uniref:Uncharacterized protein n=1 Tax=Streptomyces atratus TaxID=1893 RepID=A0A2Z5JMK3_STRAR|nr:hypothetical protein C5746_36015 [Streptomyces atratus]